MNKKHIMPFKDKLRIMYLYIKIFCFIVISHLESLLKIIIFTVGFGLTAFCADKTITLNSFLRDYDKFTNEGKINNNTMTVNYSLRFKCLIDSCK